MIKLQQVEDSRPVVVMYMPAVLSAKNQNVQVQN